MYDFLKTIGIAGALIVAGLVTPAYAVSIFESAQPDLLITATPGAFAPSQAADASFHVAQNDDGVTAAEGLALSIFGIGAAIIANEVAEEVLTEDAPPQAPQSNQGLRVGVRINSVRAIETTFGFGGDEIFLRSSTGERFPANSNSAQSIDEGQTWSPGATFGAAGGVSIDLREYDSISSSDLIGSLSVSENHDAGRFSVTLRGGGAVYEINYDVAYSDGPQAQQTGQQQPASSSRVWAAHNTYNSITVTDCRDDCEEDIGLILMCQGAGLPALLEVPYAATENGPAGAQRPISFNVGNQRFDYTATLGNYGLVGHVPAVEIYPGDPLIPAMQAGNALRISFGGSTANIGLRGSRSALDIFNAHCDWDNAATTAAPTQPQQPEHSDQVEPFWFGAQYADADTGAQIKSLIFGIPETDAVGFSASCHIGAQNPQIQVDLLVDFGTYSSGAQAPVYIQTSSATFQFSGVVFAQSSEWSGVQFFAQPSDPVWQALRNESQQITYGVAGLPQTRASTRGASGAIDEFINACSTPMGAPNPVAQQAPDSGTNTYTCSDGSTLNVTLVPAGATTIANVQPGNGEQVTLISVPTQVGTKYSNGEATLIVAGGAVQFAANGDALFCAAG